MSVFCSNSLWRTWKHLLLDTSDSPECIVYFPFAPIGEHAPVYSFNIRVFDRLLSILSAISTYLVLAPIRTGYSLWTSSGFQIFQPKTLRRGSTGLDIVFRSLMGGWLYVTCAFSCMHTSGLTTTGVSTTRRPSRGNSHGLRRTCKISLEAELKAGEQRIRNWLFEIT